MDENLKATNRKRLQNAAQALRKNGFDTEVFPTAASAAKHILALVGSGKTIGAGGSMSVETLGILEKLKAAGNASAATGPGMDDGERRRVSLKAQAADFYFASPQAVTAGGELMFLDGIGNRASAVIYGPGKVVLVAGRNKLVKDLNEGLWRMRNVAAIANNIRLSKKNPCVDSGVCEDCSSPERICNAVVMLWKKPRRTEYKVLLVDEELGY